MVIDKILCDRPRSGNKLVRTPQGAGQTTGRGVALDSTLELMNVGDDRTFLVGGSFEQSSIDQCVGIYECKAISSERVPKHQLVGHPLDTVRPDRCCGSADKRVAQFLKYYDWSEVGELRLQRT